MQRKPNTPAENGQPFARIVLGADSVPETIPTTTRLGVSRDTPKQRIERPHNSHRWRKIRKMSATTEPLCRLCQQPTTTVDHIDGNPKCQRAFNLQSLCTKCHNWKTEAFEKRGIYLHTLTAICSFRFYLDKLHDNFPEQRRDASGGIPSGGFRYPEYEVFPKPFVSDTQFIACLFGSHLYYRLMQQYNNDHDDSMSAWYNVATPLVNSAKGLMKTKTAGIVDEFIDGANGNVAHIFPQAGCTFAELLRIACVMHTFEHYKQGA